MTKFMQKSFSVGMPSHVKQEDWDSIFKSHNLTNTPATVETNAKNTNMLVANYNFHKEKEQKHARR